MPRRSVLRASDSDREGIAERLRKAAHEGRITTEELEHRLSRAFKARTYGELDSVIADLPRPVARRRRGRAARAGRLAARHPVAAIVVASLAVAAVAVTVAMLVVLATAWAGWIVFAWIFLGSRRCGLRWARRHRLPAAQYSALPRSRSHSYWA